MIPPDPARILVVAADGDLGRALELRLAAEGFAAVVEADPRAALARLADGAFDLVVVEVVQESGSDFAWVERSQAVAPGVPIVVLGAARASTRAARARACGAASYVSKASEPSLLVAAVRAAIDARGCGAPSSYRS